MLTILFIIVLFFTSYIDIIQYGNAHSMFNSAESIIGNYRIQIATLPEIPTTGERSEILFRIQDKEFNNVDEFIMGIRIYENDTNIDNINPVYHNGYHWKVDYIFKKSGNHIFMVDLYDLINTEITTYKFNVSTHNPFGYIFICSIAIGSIGVAIILTYVYVPRIKQNALYSFFKIKHK